MLSFMIKWLLFLLWGGQKIGYKHTWQAIVYHYGSKGDVFKIVLKYFLLKYFLHAKNE